MSAHASHRRASIAPALRWSPIASAFASTPLCHAACGPGTRWAAAPSPHRRCGVTNRRPSASSRPHALLSEEARGMPPPGDRRPRPWPSWRGGACLPGGCPGIGGCLPRVGVDAQSGAVAAPAGLVVRMRDGKQGDREGRRPASARRAVSTALGASSGHEAARSVGRRAVGVGGRNRLATPPHGAVCDDPLPARRLPCRHSLDAALACGWQMLSGPAGDGAWHAGATAGATDGRGCLRSEGGGGACCAEVWCLPARLRRALLMGGAVFGRGLVVGGRSLGGARASLFVVRGRGSGGVGWCGGGVGDVSRETLGRGWEG
jgi:hypothetical protein